MTTIETVNSLLTAACICTTIAIKLQCRDRIKANNETLVGAVDMAYKRGVAVGVATGVNQTFNAIAQSIDSGCDVTDIRDGMANGYVPMIHRDRKVDA